MHPTTVLASPSPLPSLYDRLAPLYDLVYGLGLQPGRRRALVALAPRAGERVLEVGIGTGLGALRYPPGVEVVGVDISAAMLRRAALRLRHRAARVSLARMDASALALPDAAFDAVYAPYLVNVVPDPVAVGRELRRVCRPGGRVILLNHFSGIATSPAVDRLAGRLAARLGAVDWHIDLAAFLAGAGLAASSVERVNLAGVSTLVVCRVPPQAFRPSTPPEELP